ncbi:methanobactin export MATE transporter MbnM [Thiomicrorhabdus sp.]|uniref:methanobactin export MATE transporter MbnM n=1 Tax=Thiomicrorhabdus sp. TaxID=2039724 RepID=UPI0029C76EC4|nr:methanobactin export MATE transporter MbnM [Thiomicrorhabdus sp.]
MPIKPSLITVFKVICMVLIGVPAAGLTGCQADVALEETVQTGAENSKGGAISSASGWQWELPPGFPEPFVPEDNPMSEAKFQLGRHLFYDKRLSGNGTQACASCHFQHLAFTDGRASSLGATGEATARSSMSIVNVAYYPTLTWANPSQYSLEIQAQVPMFVDNVGVELGINDENKLEVLARFQNDAAYRYRFAQAFPGEDAPIHFGNIVKAIASFERGLISADSRYDRAERGEVSLAPDEERGKRLFFGDQGRCSQCHSGFNFSDQTYHAKSRLVAKPFHNTGLYNLDGKGAYPDSNPGLIAVMPQMENMGKFRVPSLRNIALTAPYMHDGSVATLEAVVAHYAAHGRNIQQGVNHGDGRKNPLKDPLIEGISLNLQDQKDLVAFLHTLTDESLLTNARFSDPFSSQTAGETK